MCAYRIGIDTGGTFTDGFLIDSTGAYRWAKSLTTPYDLGECFRKVLQELADRAGIPLDELIRDAELMCYSTTHGTNTLLEESGPRVGVIVSPGISADLVAAIPTGLLAGDMVVELPESCWENGQLVGKAAVREAAEELNDRGARSLVVALRDGSTSPELEREVAAEAAANCAEHSFGWIPVFAATDVSDAADDTARTVAAVVTAHIGRPLARFLYPLERELRGRHMRRPLLVATGGGDVTRVASALAIDTLQSGPAYGALAASKVADGYGWDRVLCVDIGGTSTDISVVEPARRLMGKRFSTDGFAVTVPVMDIRAAAIGGSSVAHVEDGVLRVGPRSAGARPGPACFGLGGREPTVTDADLLLGIFSPDGFSGGRLHLDVERARDTLLAGVGSKLGMDADEAAVRIGREATDHLVGAVRRVLDERGQDPGEVTMLSYGGAGPTHCAAVAARLRIPRVVVLPFASTLSAFGCASSDASHSRRVPLPNGLADDLVTTVTELLEEAERAVLDELVSEGFPSSSQAVRYWLETEDEDGRTLSRHLLRAERADDAVNAARGSTGPITLIADAHVPVLETRWSGTSLPAKKPSRTSRKGRREVSFDGERVDTDIYAESALKPGTRIDGPAVVETEFTSIVVTPSAVLSVDSTGACILKLAG
ncbi:MAG: hypothetical protein GEV10_30255 [Streptosporangiales bacterium]|nr:hypothetical protein [Streptosporangiales bacterium]